MKSVGIAVLASLALTGCIIGGGANGGGPVAIGTPVNGSIGFGTQRLVIPGRSATTTYRSDTWTVPLTMGQPVTLLMCRTGTVSFDPYLSITGPAGAMDDVHTNDDGAGSLNSRIVFTPASTGTYTIYATTFSTFESNSSASGAYRLSVVAGEMPTATCPN